LNAYVIDLGALKKAYENSDLTNFLVELPYGETEPVAITLAEWHNAKQINLVGLFRSLNWNELNDQADRRWRQIFSAALSHLHIEPKVALELCYQILDIKTDATQHDVFSGFEGWLSQSETNAEITTELILGSKRDSVLLWTALLSWGKKDADKAISAAIKASSDKRLHIRSQSIRALGLIIGGSEDVIADKDNTLVEIAANEIVEDHLSAIDAILCICDDGSNSSQKLIDCLDSVAKNPLPETRNQLIAGLLFHPKAFSETLRDTVFVLMETVTSEYPATLDHIDLILYKLDTDQERNRIFNIMSAIAHQKNAAPKLDIFDSTSYKLQSGDNSVLGWFVINWLLDGQFSTCNAVNSFFPPLDQSIYNFDLSEFNLSDSEIYYLTRKVFVYLMFDHGPAVSLLAACLVAISSRAKKDLEIEIGNFWLRNFPGDIKLFKAHIKTYPSRGMKASIKRMGKMIDEYSAPLHNLPRNPAMRPSALERRAQAEIDHQRQKEISKHADKKSILGSIFHKSILLYGRSSIVYVHRGKGEDPIRQEMQLQTFETSTAIPRMDVLYPARLNYMLHKFRREKRPK